MCAMSDRKLFSESKIFRVNQTPFMISKEKCPWIVYEIKQGLAQASQHYRRNIIFQSQRGGRREPAWSLFTNGEPKFQDGGWFPEFWV